MNSLEDPNSLKNIMNEIGLDHISYKRRLEMAIRIRHFRYLERKIYLKGWNPNTFDEAITQGVVQRGKGGRFATNKDVEIQPLITQDIEDKEEDEPYAKQTLYKNYQKAIKKKNELIASMTKVSIFGYTPNDEEQEEIQKEIDKLQPEFDNINNEINQFIKTHPEASNMRKINKKIKSHEKKINDLDNKIDQHNTDWGDILREFEKLDNEDPKKVELNHKLSETTESRVKLEKKRKYQLTQIRKADANYDAELRGLAHPEKKIADDIYKFEKKHKALITSVRSGQTYINETESKIKRYNKKLLTSIGSKKYYDREIKREEEKLEVRKSNYAKAKEDWKIVKDKSTFNYDEITSKTTLRKYDYWGYIDESTYKGENEKYKKNEFSKGEMRQLFREEFNYAVKRLGIDFNEHPELLEIKLSIKKGHNVNWLGFSISSAQLININPDYFLKGKRTKDNYGYSLQEVIRHELAHHFSDWNDSRDYYKAKKIMKNWEKLSHELKYKSKEEQDKSRKEYIRNNNIIWDFSDLKDKLASKGKGIWSGGHGRNWQDTMTVLFGNKPTSATINGIQFREVEK